MSFDLAVCSEMVFTDLDIVERAKRIDDLGFQVEIWSFHDKDLDALAATGATFSSMTGYLHGDLYDPEGAQEVVRTAHRAVKAAAVLGVPRLVVHPGELVDGQAAVPGAGSPATCGSRRCAGWRPWVNSAPTPGSRSAWKI